MTEAFDRRRNLFAARCVLLSSCRDGFVARSLIWLTASRSTSESQKQIPGVFSTKAQLLGLMRAAFPGYTIDFTAAHALCGREWRARWQVGAGRALRYAIWLLRPGVAVRLSRGRRGLVAAW